MKSDIVLYHEAARASKSIDPQNVFRLQDKLLLSYTHSCFRVELTTPLITILEIYVILFSGIISLQGWCQMYANGSHHFFGARVKGVEIIDQQRQIC
jgi:hypothetical protein